MDGGGTDAPIYPSGKCLGRNAYHPEDEVDEKRRQRWEVHDAGDADSRAKASTNTLLVNLRGQVASSRAATVTQASGKPSGGSGKAGVKTANYHKEYYRKSEPDPINSRRRSESPTAMPGRPPASESRRVQIR